MNYIITVRKKSNFADCRCELPIFYACHLCHLKTGIFLLLLYNYFLSCTGLVIHIKRGDTGDTFDQNTRKYRLIVQILTFSARNTGQRKTRLSAGRCTYFRDRVLLDTKNLVKLSLFVVLSALEFSYRKS